MEELARRIDRLERQAIFWKRLAAVQLAVLALLTLLGATQGRDDLKRELVVGVLGIVGDENVTRMLSGATLPKNSRGWILNEDGLTYRGSDGGLSIAEGPDGVPSITIVDATNKPRLILGSVSIRNAGNLGGATVRPPSSIAFVDEDGAAFRTIP